MCTPLPQCHSCQQNSWQQGGHNEGAIIHLQVAVITPADTTYHPELIAPQSHPCDSGMGKLPQGTADKHRVPGGDLLVGAALRAIC